MVAAAAVATATTVASLVTFPATAPRQGREVVAAVVAVTATTATNPAISPGTAPNPGREVVEVDAEVEAVAVAAATCNATSAAVRHDEI